MPRRNNRKIYTTGKKAVFSSCTTENAGFKPECVGCAFAGYGGICTTSDGTCLKTNAVKSERREADNADRQR